jgi:predicted DNA-binding transcriptional regulator AlpA
MVQAQTKSANAAPSYLSDDRILSFRQWCELNGISEKTGRRLLSRGDGPVVTKLTSRKIGIAVRHNRAWQESRARVR